jgi:hypothetical protein
MDHPHVLLPAEISTCLVRCSDFNASIRMFWSRGRSSIFFLTQDLPKNAEKGHISSHKNDVNQRNTTYFLHGKSNLVQTDGCHR